MTVVPRGITARKHFWAPAIAWALALWGLAQEPAKAVRAKVSPQLITGAEGGRRWRSLKRWSGDVQRGVLFAGVPSLATSQASLREIAERAAMALSAWVPPTAGQWSQSDRAFFGGEQMA